MARLGFGSAPTPGYRRSRTRQVRGGEGTATAPTTAGDRPPTVPSSPCPPSCEPCSAMSVPRGVGSWLPRPFPEALAAARHASRTIRLTVLRLTAERTSRLATLIRSWLRLGAPSRPAGGAAAGDACGSRGSTIGVAGRWNGRSRWSANARQTARRLRPLARRARITAWPPRVFWRTRKPWVLLRRQTDGW